MPPSINLKKPSRRTEEYRIKNRLAAAKSRRIREIKLRYFYSYVRFMYKNPEARYILSILAHRHQELRNIYDKLKNDMKEIDYDIVNFANEIVE